MSETAISKDLISRFEAFSSLEPENLEWLSTRFQLFTSNVGSDLLIADRMPEYCFCILEGRGRLLHQDPGLRRAVTVAFSQPGDLIGWIGLHRRAPCEWVTCSMTMKLLGIKAEDFYWLEKNSQAFSNWLTSKNSPAEFMDTLTPALRRRSIADPPERDVLRELLPGMHVVTYTAGNSLPNDDSIWLWNGLPNYQNSLSIKIGEPVDLQLLKELEPNSYIRLLRIDRSLWEEFVDLSNVQKAGNVETPKLNPGDMFDRYSDLILPEPQGKRLETNNSDDEQKKANSSLDSKFPVRTGVGSLEQIMACLEMLSLYYKIPFRSDIIERIARENLRGKPPSLQLVGNISTILGLTGYLTPTAQDQLYRIPCPCIALISSQPSVIYEINEGQVRAVVPEYGRVSLSIEEFVGDEGGANILTLTPGRDAQRRKLNFKWFVPQLNKYRRSLIEVFLASLVLQLTNLATPLIFQQIFDKVIGQQNLDTLYTLGIVLLVISMFQGLLGAVRSYLFTDTTNRIDISLGGEVIQHLLRLPLSYFDRRPVGELQTRIAELGNIRNFLTGNAITLVLDVVFSLIYVAVMLSYSGVLTAVSLAVVPLFLGLTIIASPLIRAQLRKAAEKNAKTQALLVEALSGVQTIKAQNAENSVRWNWQQRYSAFMSESFRTLLIGISTGTVGTFLNQLTGLLTLWVGAYLVIKGDLTIGQLIAFRIISNYVVGPLLNLATSWQNFQRVALSMERLSDVVDAVDESGGELTDQLPLPPINGDVSFQNVDFAFQEGNNVVSGVSFDIKAGSFIGIVGRSGSGKSTIMKLLPRLYEPEKGRILIDGYDLSKLQLASVRRQIGIVPQDSLLFDGTIRENIALTVPEATSEEIAEAARIAVAHEFIMELPEGYATRVGERGSGLSGGQRQRIAIARAVLQKPSLLILDEATSALDYITERQVCLNLKRIFSGTTVFFITHRLSTIRASDEILLMETGNLVEKGSHNDLMALKGRYYALYSQQEADLD